VLEERAAQGRAINSFRPPRRRGWHLIGDLPLGQAMARVSLREIWPPAISASPDDDVFDIDPR
jgi:hypothetical protein